MGLVCELEYGIFSTFIDSESFGLQSDPYSRTQYGEPQPGTSWELGHLWLEFRLQIPSVVLEIRFRPMYTMSGLKRERGLYESVTERFRQVPRYTPFFALLACACDDRVGGGHAVGHWSIQGAGLNPWVRA